LIRGLLAIAIAVLLTAPSARLSAQQSTDPEIRIGNNDLGGVVMGPNGPEAGVWVIAETTDLPTKFAKIVVTDERGRYVMPDLPEARYQVWVCGYGLVDSPKVETTPGQLLNLQASVAPTAAAAADYYPAIYWYAMLKIPAKSEFPGTGVGWLNRRLYEQTGDEVKSQGWTPFVHDTNGNGKRDEYVGPDQPVDPSKDKRVVTGLYSVNVNPVDGSVWGTSLGVPGYVVRIAPGADPTHTALT
jgi:hypothetical protein